MGIANQEDKLITIKEVRGLLGVSPATIYRWLTNTDFPKPLVLGPKAIRWWRSDILSWVASRKGPARRAKAHELGPQWVTRRVTALRTRKTCA